jgi:choline kinase
MGATLLVLAAGMGSRYGGLKQLDPVGPAGETILDFSVHDALHAGFSKVVFVIRRDFEGEFADRVLSRYSDAMEIELAFQSLDALPNGFVPPPGRQKPWGTGHAIWCAREVVEEPFLAVNADDFYGRQAFEAMRKFLEDGSADTLRMGMVAYQLVRTLSEHGTVSRGVCTLNASGTLSGVHEHTGIARQENGEITGLDAGGNRQSLSPDSPVSMNFWGFTPPIFNALGALLHRFLAEGAIHDPKAEFYIPSAVTHLTAGCPVFLMQSPEQWFGVTYREDRATVAAELARLVRDGIYPSPLWPATL